MGVEYHEEYMRNARGVQLFTCRWLPFSSPKALVFLCHGYGMECSGFMRDKMVSTRSGGGNKSQSQGSIQPRNSKRKRDEKESETSQTVSKRLANEGKGDSQPSIDMDPPKQLNESEKSVGDDVVNDEVGVDESSEEDVTDKEVGEAQIEGGAGRDEEGREGQNDAVVNDEERGQNEAGGGVREGEERGLVDGGNVVEEERGEIEEEREQLEAGDGAVEAGYGAVGEGATEGDRSCGERVAEGATEGDRSCGERVAEGDGAVEGREEARGDVEDKGEEVEAAPETSREQEKEKETGGENFNVDEVVGDVIRDIDEYQSEEERGEEIADQVGENLQVHLGREVAFTPQDNLRTHMDVHGESKAVSRFAVRSSIGGSFGDFRKVLVKHGFDKSFKRSIFGHLLGLNVNAIFAPKLVHGLRERFIVCEKKKELWVNFNGLPVRFGLREFALMTGLKCHSYPSDEYLLGEVAEKGKSLWFSITNEGKLKSVTSEQLLEVIDKSTTISRPQKFRLCLAWFAHAILCAKDKRTSVPKKFIHLSSRPNTYFNEYPWGRESFELTIKYLLLQSVEKRDFTLYGFPWAFMAWAYEAIPSLRHGEFPDLPTEPRMIRWISDKQERECEQLFHNTVNPVVTPCLIPTPRETEKDFMKRFVPFVDVEDEVIDRLTESLDGVSRLTLAVQIQVDEHEDGSRVRGSVGDGGNDGDFRASGMDDRVQDVDAPVQEVGAEHEIRRRVSFSAFDGVVGGGYNRGFERSMDSVGDGRESYSRSHNCCQCKLCQVCKEEKEKEKKMLTEMKEALDSLLQWSKQQPRRTVYPARTLLSPYMSIKKRSRNVRNKKGTPIADKLRDEVQKQVQEQVHEEVHEHIDEEVEERLPVDLYRPADPAKRKAFDAYMRGRKPKKIMVMGHEYNRHEFNMIVNMIEWLESQHVDVIMALMRIRHKEFPSHYDKSDVILDMNFCSVLAGSYVDAEKMAGKADITLDEYLKVTPTAQGLVDYVLGKTPYPGGRRWDGAKRVFTIMNLICKHYVTVVFMLEEGRIDVYDCNIGTFDEDAFATYMLPIMLMFPRLLRDCGKFKHLPDDILNREMWPYERLTGLPHNDTGTACGGYSLMYIEHLLTNTPMTELSDNTMEDCRYKWAVDVFNEKMTP